MAEADYIEEKPELDDSELFTVPGNENFGGESTSEDKDTFESSIESEKTKAKLKKLLDRGEPVNILVVGPTGAGKSTLINALFGKDVAKVGHGPKSVTSEMHAYEGKYKGVLMKIYDNLGFRDTGGQSDIKILNDIAIKNVNFDLVLICSKLEDRLDCIIFEKLASHLREEMWKRTVVVLTQANRFLTLATVDDTEPEVEIEKAVDEYKALVEKTLSDSVKDEILKEISFRIAGLSRKKKKLPTTDDWWKSLWETCIDRCSDETRPFLTAYARYRYLIEGGAVAGSVAAGAGLGAIVGASIGSVVPVFGTVAGGVGGAVIGGIVGGSTSSIGIGAKRAIDRLRNNSHIEIPRLLQPGHNLAKL